MLSKLIRRKQHGSQPVAAPLRPRSLSSVLDGLVAQARLVQALLLAAGLLGLFLVPLLERKIEFDENALLAGSARPTIR